MARSGPTASRHGTVGLELICDAVGQAKTNEAIAILGAAIAAHNPATGHGKACISALRKIGEAIIAGGQFERINEQAQEGFNQLHLAASSSPVSEPPMNDSERDCFSDEGLHNFRDGESVCICGEAEIIGASPVSEPTVQARFEIRNDNELWQCIGEVPHGLKWIYLGRVTAAASPVSEIVQEMRAFCKPSMVSGSNEFGLEQKVREWADRLAAGSPVSGAPPTEKLELRRLDTPENRDFWASVKEAQEQWERIKPDWARRLEAAQAGAVSGAPAEK